MKHHIILKLQKNIPEIALPHWTGIIKRKSEASSSFHPEIDRILSAFNLPVWIAREYLPASTNWSDAEIQSGLNQIYRLILKNNTQIPTDLIKNISLLPIIEYAKIGKIGTRTLPQFQYSAMTAATGKLARKMIYLDEAHLITQGDPSIIIAVLDTGVVLSHPELQHTILPGFDFVNIIEGTGKFIGDFLGYDEDASDEVGHGTHVAGIVAGKGLAMSPGVAPLCRILPVRVLGTLKRGDKVVGAGLVDNINVAIKWAVDQGADVINMSLGIRHTGGGLPHKEVVEYAQKKDVTIIAASGNDGNETLYYPGALPHVITVGAFDESGEVAHFSNFGKQVDFVAPGANIYSTYLDHDYAFSSGTSHAAPFVSGAAALLKSYSNRMGKHMSHRQIKYILKHTSDKIDQRFKNQKAGFGKINLSDALRLLKYKLN